MRITTHTGGQKEFGYAKPSEDPEFDERISKAYEKARKRKKIEGRGMLILALLILGVILLKYWF